MYHEDLTLLIDPGNLQYTVSEILYGHLIDHYMALVSNSAGLDAGTDLVYLGENRGEKIGEYYIGTHVRCLLHASSGCADSLTRSVPILHVHNPQFIESIRHSSYEKDSESSAELEGFYRDMIES